MRYLVIFLAGALGALLANRGISVFNDAVRPIVPEYREGRMSRAELATTTFALSFGLVIGFGIPFSIMSPIILVHSLWLGTDIIGMFFPAPINVEKWYKDKQSLIGAGLSVLCGGVYGILLMTGLQGFVNVMGMLPVNIFDSWMSISGPVIYAFSAFPCIVIAMDYGWKKGLASLGIVLLVRQIVVTMGQEKVADGAALFIAILLVVLFAFTDKTNKDSQTDMASLFGDRVKNIRKNLPWIAAMGGVYAWAVNIKLLMEGPQSLVAMADGDKASAISIAIARALSFIPLKGLTSISTGTFAVDGFGFTAVVGILAPNAILAILLGAVVMSTEAFSLIGVAKLFDRFPGVKRSADSMRQAMTKLLEIALLVGSMNAANGMFPGMGFFIVAGLFAMNEYFKKPLVRMAVGPIATIIVALLVNVLALVGLYAVPV